ncbi:hypothetical protein BuS5_00642 [Desulfosarcina sp. BuS5]|nr:hypothetical protein BuS5_00642 [Desulfosarcina sp. BuS5]
MTSFLVKIMSFDTDNQLKLFVEQFIKSHGGEAVNNQDGLEALLPEKLAAELSEPEYLNLQFGADSKGDHKISYGSPLLDKIVNSACRELPISVCRLNFQYLKTQGFNRLIKELFAFSNAVGHVDCTARVMTEYILLQCKYLAQSDEQKEGLLAFVFNLETGSEVPAMAWVLDDVEKKFKLNKNKINFSEEKIKTLLNSVQRNAGPALAPELEPFQASMNRRYRRDVTNLDEYYAALQQEMEESLKRPGLSEQLITDRKEKIALIPDELAKKKDDLFKKYSIRVSLELCGAMLIRTPAVKVLYQASIGRSITNISMFYNPATKSMDPLVCRKCKKSTFNPYFSDDLQIFCPDCIGS